MGRKLFFLLAAGWLAGCAAPKVGQLPPASVTIPADGVITQRGVLTVLGRQFTLTGYLAVSATGGKRLVVTENFGGVLADVLVKPDGRVFVMRANTAFKPDWVRTYIAGDLECIFGKGAEGNCPGRMISPNHFLIQRRWYKLDLQIVQTKAGAQSSELFDETKALKL